MSKVLVVTDDGKYSKYLLTKIANEDSSKNTYHIIHAHQEDIELKNKLANNTNITLYKSYIKSNLIEMLLIKHNYQHVTICLKTKLDTQYCIDKLLKLDTKSSINFLNNWPDFKFEHKLVQSIDVGNILTSYLANSMPNTIVSANNIGNDGEIIEIQVLPDSNFIYKRISNIKQKDFQISAIYRDNKLLLPTKSSMILPNDKLIAIGQADSLINFNNSVNKLEYFLSNKKTIYLLIDMSVMNKNEISMSIKKTIKIYEKLKLKSITIGVANVNDIDTLNKIKNLDNDFISIDISFDRQSKFILNAKSTQPSLLMVHKKLFQKYTKLISHIKCPIWSINSGNIPKDAILIPSIKNNKLYENIGSSVFDFGSRMDISVDVFIEQEKEVFLQDVQNYYNMLSHILKKTVSIMVKSQNPFAFVKRSKKKYIHILPVSNCIYKSNKLTAIFSKNPDLLYYKLNGNDQLFLPF